MAELSILDQLDDETRAELDIIEGGTADLERQIRAATTAVEAEEAEQRAAQNGEPVGDAEDHERAELRGKVKLTGYLSAAIEQRSAVGAEAEFNAAVGIAGNRFRSNCWHRQNSGPHAPRTARPRPSTPRRCRGRGLIDCSRRLPQ